MHRRAATKLRPARTEVVSTVGDADLRPVPNTNQNVVQFYKSGGIGTDSLTLRSRDMPGNMIKTGSITSKTLQFINKLKSIRVHLSTATNFI